MGLGQGLPIDESIGPAADAASAEVGGSRLLDFAPSGTASGATAIVTRTAGGRNGEIELQVGAPGENGQISWARLWGTNTEGGEAAFVNISACCRYRFRVSRAGMTARVQLVG